MDPPLILGHSTVAKHYQLIIQEATPTSSMLCMVLPFIIRTVGSANLNYPKPYRLMTLSVSTGALCLLLVLVVSSCGASAEPDPYIDYRVALKADAQDHLDLLGPVPEYTLNVTVTDDLSRLNGIAHIKVPNNSPHDWNHLVFRLYPVLAQYGGQMTIQSATVDGKPASFDYQPGIEKSAIRVFLASPLFDGESTDVNLTWRLDIPKWPDVSSLYHLFGRSQQITSLPLFYPALAVYDPERSFGQGEWWTEIGNVRGDAAFSNISLFRVTATLPADQVPVTSGTLISSTFINETQSRHIWVTGPSREFVLHFSAQFNFDYVEAYGTRVTSYWLPGDESSGRAALTHAVASLRIFSDKYDPYPFRDLRIAPAPLAFRGMEYPQVSLLGVEVYNRFLSSLESLVAHEVAHQWWYQIVHNDPVNMPWLDESLAEYSIKLYIESIYGQDSADRMQERRWDSRVSGLDDNQLYLNRPVMSFESGPVYEAVIYSKGALFYDRLRSIIGDRNFERFLQNYYRKYRYQIVDTEDWLTELNTLGDDRMIPLYQEWIDNSLPVAQNASQ